MWAEITGAYRDQVGLYRRMDVAQRTQSLLRTASSKKGIPADPSMLTCSPFGWHGPDFLHLALDRTLDLGGRHPLHIGCFGGGFHNAYEFIRASLAHTGPSEAISHYRPLLDAQLSIFGPQMATSYEPRELSALFYAGNRPGSVTVVDCTDAIGEDLIKPRFARLRGTALSPHVEFDDFYWQILSAGRHVFADDHGEVFGEIIQSMRFDLEPWEVERIRFIRADLLLDDVPVPSEFFDLSIRTEFEYFFPPETSVILGAYIVSLTRIGGYYLVDAPLYEEAEEQLGLRLVRALSNPINRPFRGDNIFAFLYQRVEDTEIVKGVVETRMETIDGKRG